MDKVSIIIPVKDEEKGLEYLLQDFESSGLEKEFDIDFIFAIDERTSDNSTEIARKFSNQIIDQGDAHGKGAAMRQATRLWKKNKTPKVVFLDADGSYSFNSVRNIIGALDNASDVVSGSRFLSKKGRPEGMTRLHNFGNKILSIISSIRNRRRISDLCTGLWGFNRDALERLNFKSNGFGLEAELAGLVRREKLAHLEVPVEWSQRKGGTTKLRSFTDGLIILIRIIIT